MITTTAATAATPDPPSDTVTVPVPAIVFIEQTFQGKTAQWWAARAVRARRDANRRAALIKELRAKLTRRLQSRRPAHYSQWLCIHGLEGSWQDTGDPYWGGLQMDGSFMATYAAEAVRLGYLDTNVYAAKGTADQWSPIEQMWVAEAAYQSRGFYPWPNTARACGLL